MTYSFYKFVHLAGMMGLFLAFGSMLAGNAHRTFTSILHGISLVAMVVAGFGMLAKMGILKGMPPSWVLVKLLIWLLFGALMAVIRRRPAFSGILFWVILALGGVAGYLGIFHDQGIHNMISGANS